MSRHEIPVRILIVDDDDTDVFIIREHIKGIAGQNFQVDQCRHYDEALRLISQKKYDLYFIDYRLGAQTGLDLLRNALFQGCEEPLILLTGKGNSAIDHEAMELGAADYLLKSEISSENLDRSIRYALSRAAVLKALRTSERKYRAVFERSREAILITDGYLNLKDFNGSASTLFETSADMLLERNLFDFIPNEQAREKIHNNLEEKGEVTDIEVDVVDSRGETKNCLLSLSRDTSSPDAVNVYGIIHNISSLKKAEKAMLHAEKLAATWRLASTLAHEVRNPLSTIQMSVEQLDASGIAEEDRVLLEIISRNSQRINALITRLLESSRPDEVQLKAVDVRGILQECVGAIEDRTRLKGIDVTLDVPRESLIIKANAERMKMAILNILVNAIEAVEAGKGRIHIRVSSTNEHCIIHLADNGCGIPTEHLPNLFEPYFTSKKSGIGLGLAATLNIVKAHAGEIDVTSVPLKETVFKITLPRVAVDVEAATYHRK
jgi:PAS domain S-box-containing protein